MAKAGSGPSDVVNQAVDVYIGRAEAFAQPILRYLREAVHEGAPGVVEEIKWSRPFFVYKGVILGNMSAFKEHCSFGLWGQQVEQALRTDGTAVGGGMGSLGKIKAPENLPARERLVAYVRLAARAIAEGDRTKAWTRPNVAKPELEVPEAFAVALASNTAAAKVFEAKGAGWRREYCEWIAAAERQETQQTRIATAMQWIAEGKGRNWKYETAPTKVISK